MATKKYISPAALIAAALLVGGIGFPQTSAASTAGMTIGQQSSASEVQGKLNKSQFKDVKVSVDKDGIATLTGTVNLYEYKKDAANESARRKA